MKIKFQLYEEFKNFEQIVTFKNLHYNLVKNLSK